MAVVLGAAGPPPADRDWPCIQRLVPGLTAGTFWAGHGEATDWRGDPAVAALVGQVSSRSRPLEAGSQALQAYVAGLPAAARAGAAETLFAGLVEETNAQRATVIDRLRGIGRRQRELTDTVAAVTTALRALPADAPPATREELTTRRLFLIRTYDEVGRTVRYACEVPVELEARLGAFARALQDASKL